MTDFHDTLTFSLRVIRLFVPLLGALLALMVVVDVPATPRLIFATMILSLCASQGLVLILLAVIRRTSGAGR